MMTPPGAISTFALKSGVVTLQTAFDKRVPF